MQRTVLIEIKYVKTLCKLTNYLNICSYWGQVMKRAIIKQRKDDRNQNTKSCIQDLVILFKVLEAEGKFVEVYDPNFPLPKKIK